MLLLLYDMLNDIVCYFLQDYHWWWRSYLTGACTAIYLFIYSFYYFHKLTIVGTTSTVLYYGYTSIMVILFFLYTGKFPYSTKFMCKLNKRYKHLLNLKILWFFNLSFMMCIEGTPLRSFVKVVLEFILLYF